jgi:enoyl-[acyl-carrier protein] reductase I
MLKIDLTGKRALVAGVADDAGYGFAIAKELAEAGASVVVGTWPPALNIFRNLLERGKMDESLVLSSGAKMSFESIHPLDAEYTTLASAPATIRENKRYAGVGDFSIDGLATKLVEDYGEKPLDIVVHSLANGPEVKKALLDTSREGYLTALSVSAYSLIALVSRFGPLMRAGGSVLSLTYMASERVIPGYGGGMSSAKAALESDTRVLAFEAGRRFGIRVQARSRAASRGASSTWIKAITPWGWPFPTNASREGAFNRARELPCSAVLPSSLREALHEWFLHFVVDCSRTHCRRARIAGRGWSRLRHSRRHRHRHRRRVHWRLALFRSRCVCRRRDSGIDHRRLRRRDRSDPDHSSDSRRHSARSVARRYITWRA